MRCAATEAELRPCEHENAALRAFDEVRAALPPELRRQWKEGELRQLRLLDAQRVQRETEALAPAHAAALQIGVEGVLALTDEDPLAARRALWDWHLWARPTQLQPSDAHWSIWLILAGRGWGKTRTGVEWIRERVQSGDARSIGLIGPSLGEVWKQLVFGTPDAPGLARIFPRWERRVEVRRQDRQVVLHEPSCGATGVECGCPVATVFTAEEPEVRGPNIDTWLCDELAKWRYLETCWDNIEMTTRAVGSTPPRICVTTTPRPLPILLRLLDDVDVRVTWGNTFANAANVASKWLARMARRYAGSRLGLQELFGQILGDNPDALFQQSLINATRVEHAPKLIRVVVAVDPAISTSKASDLTGITVLGIDARGHVYVLADLTGVGFERERDGAPFCGLVVRHHAKDPKKHTPGEWGELVCRAVEFFGADAVVVERNCGGDLVRANVLNAWQEALRLKLVTAPTVRVQEVIATKGKQVRAEPVAALFEQGRMHLVGNHHDLESEVTNWNPKNDNPGKSPGRLDSMVWGTFALAGLGEEPPAAPPSFAGLVEANQKLAQATAAAPRGMQSLIVRGRENRRGV